jgi:RES domain-containing protein
MTPLPAPLAGGPVTAWRLDARQHAAEWDRGEGAFRFGGRWNAPGSRVVYCAFDPATAILEVAVHKGFATLDTVPHVLTACTITAPSAIHVVLPADIPNVNWLRPGFPSAGQQAFGDELLRRHGFVAVPSVVSSHSWNLLFLATAPAGAYGSAISEPFALDRRLHPPAPRSPPP